MKKNCVSINLKKDKIIIKLNEDTKQEELVECLKKKLPELKKLYKDEKTPINVTGKVLKNKEIEEIQNIIKEKIDVEIEFDSPKTLGLHGIKKTFEKEIEQMNIGICLLKQKEIIDIIKNINHVSFEFYQEKHKEYYLATQLVQFMYYLLLQADHEENTLQDYHHSLQNVSLLFIYIIKKIFLLKKLLLMEI